MGGVRTSTSQWDARGAMARFGLARRGGHQQRAELVGGPGRGSDRAAAGSAGLRHVRARSDRDLRRGHRSNRLEICVDTSREAFSGDGESVALHAVHRNVLHRPVGALQDEPVGYLCRCCALRAGNELKDGTVHLRLPRADEILSAEACGHAWRSSSVSTAHSRRTNHPLRWTGLGQRAAHARRGLVAAVWRPGRRTAVHDHAAQCVVGVHRGEAHETRCRLGGAMIALRTIELPER